MFDDALRIIRRARTTYGDECWELMRHDVSEFMHSLYNTPRLMGSPENEFWAICDIVFQARFAI